MPLSRSAWLGGAGVVVAIIGLAKTIEPMIELGIALVVMALIAKPTS